MRLVFLFCFLLPFLVKAQSDSTNKHCGTDEMHQQLFLDHPEFNQGIIRAALKSEEFRNQFSISRENRTTPYIIPVVFHVIHNYGPENISDAQIMDGINVVNKNYRKKNADTIDIIPAFQSIAADNEVELRLAQLDPSGNCTSGINRIVSNLTYTGGHDVKDLIHWDPSKYLNVYVVDNAAGLAGHALVPPAADTIPQWDGIVISYNSVGSIEASNYVRSVVLSHELGHYLSLEHIWGGNNVPGYYYLPCADAGNCAFDDGVLDTPNTIGWQTCNLNGASCGSTVDNVQNFMDYAYCARMFTEGQKTRIHACLNDTIANRNNLWQPANLIATGTDGTNYLCAADFSVDNRIICEGESVVFTDNSYHGITQRNWTFTGGIPSSTTDSVVTVTYNTAGTYNVSLIAGNGSSTVNETKTNFITVVPANGITAPLIEGFESTVSLPSSDWYVNNPHNDAEFEISTTVSSSGNNSVTLDLANAEEDYFDELYSRTFDVSALSVVQVSFRYAFTNRDTVPTSNLLKFSVSNDCGNTWIVRKQYSTAVLNTAPGISTGNFIPNGTQWKTAVVNNISASYLVNDFRFKFTYENVDGVALYIDDINISPTASIGEIDLNNLKLFPNPGEDEISLNLEQNGVFEIKIYDMSGREISSETKWMDKGSQRIATSSLANGTYLINLISFENQSIYRGIWVKSK